MKGREAKRETDGKTMDGESSKVSMDAEVRVAGSGSGKGGAWITYLCNAYHHVMETA